MRVKNDYDVAGGYFGTDDARFDQTHTFVGADELDGAVEAFDVLLELLLEELCVSLFVFV